MKCPICSCRVGIIRTIKGFPVRRQRECEGCGKRFDTLEVPLLPPGCKVRKAGSRGVEDFDRSKLAKTLEWMSGENGLTPLQCEEILHEVEYHLLFLVNQNVFSSSLLAGLLYKSVWRRNQGAAKRFSSRYLDQSGSVLFEREVDLALSGLGAHEESEQLTLFEP